MNKIQGGFSLLTMNSKDNQDGEDNNSADNNNKLNKHRENIIKNSFRLAPFMRLYGRGGMK